MKNPKTTSHQSSWSDTIAKVLVVGAMPFLYGAATRLPFIYFVIHLHSRFDLDWWTIGLYVASYQASRVMTSAVSVAYPKLSHFIGTCAGLAGYVTVFVSDKDLVAPFGIGTAIIGFSETMSSMQKYAKEMYKLDTDRKKANTMLKYQYASVMIGVMFAFLIGGFVYQYRQINGVALFGIIVESLALLALLIFLCLSDKEPVNTASSPDCTTEQKITTLPVKNPITIASKDIKLHNISKAVDGSSCANITVDDSTHTNMTLDMSIYDSCHEETNVDISCHTSTEENVAFEDKEEGLTEDNSTVSKICRLSFLLDISNAKYPTSDIPATWVNWLLCASFGIEALTIGYNLSIGPLFLLTEFNKGTSTIGVMFAVGAASGTVAAIGVTCTTFGNKLMRSIAKSPFDLCFAMGFIAVSVLVAAIPNFAAHVTGVIMLMCFNDLGATLMTELQGSITTAPNYSFLGPLGQVVRRSLNVVTALSGPVLYGIYPRLPYIVAGTITLLWTAMLIVLFKIRRKKIVEEVSKKTGQNKKTIKHTMPFSTTEVVHSMLGVLDRDDYNDVTTEVKEEQI